MYILALLSVALFASSAFAGDLVTTDHYVQVTSKVPVIEGQTTQVYAPYECYSWMKHLARTGFDTFSMDDGVGAPRRVPTSNVMWA